MFEKEAEEYFKSICGDYNEEYERTGKRHYFVGFDIKNGYLAGAEFGYNKANEWHYVKNGDLPKDEKLCLIWCGEKDFNTAEYVRERFWDLCGGWLEVDEVIAWKEIVLPELKESE